MSSIDHDLNSMLLDFYESKISTAATELRNQRINIFQIDQTRSSQSTYILRADTRMEPNDFELNLSDIDEVKGFIKNQFSEEERIVLNSLVEEILALAPYFDAVEEVEDVSPFIYVMF